jgi:hypothetical protein
LLKFHSICSNFVLICFFIWFYFYSDGSNSQQCAHRSNWEKHYFIIFQNSHKLTFVLCFSSTPSLWDFFQLSFACHVHLKIGICSLNIMLINNVNSLTPWNSQNPYIPRLNKKQALWASSRKKENGNFQHYNILSAYEVQDETSTSSTYVSLVFYCTIRSRKILVKN